MSQTLGYNVGGNLQSAPLLGGKGAFNYSKKISYTQKNYISEVAQQNSKISDGKSKQIHLIQKMDKYQHMTDTYLYEVLSGQMQETFCAK